MYCASKRWEDLHFEKRKARERTEKLAATGFSEELAIEARKEMVEEEFAQKIGELETRSRKDKHA